MAPLFEKLLDEAPAAWLGVHFRKEDIDVLSGLLCDLTGSVHEMWHSGQEWNVVDEKTAKDLFGEENGEDLEDEDDFNQEKDMPTEIAGVVQGHNRVLHCDFDVGVSDHICRGKDSPHEALKRDDHLGPNEMSF